MCPTQFSFLSHHYPIILHYSIKEADFGILSTKFGQSQLRILSPLSKPHTKPYLFRKKWV